MRVCGLSWVRRNGHDTPVIVRRQEVLRGYADAKKREQFLSRIQYENG